MTKNGVATTQPRQQLLSLQLSPERRTALRRLRFFMHLAWVLPLLSFIVAAALLYRDAFNDAKRAIDHGSRVAQEQALKLFETNVMVLQRMLDILGDSRDEEVLARGEQLHERLKRMADELPQVQGLFINGSDAKALVTSLVYPPPRGIDYSDREFFTVHRVDQQPVFFTEQLTSRITGEAFFDMSRRRVYRDGTFAGSVHVSLKPGYLTDFYAELASSEPGLRFAVFRSDGKFLARWPDGVPPGARVPDAILDTLASSAGNSLVRRGPAAVDGAERLQMFRRLSPYPLWVVTSISVADIRADWLANVGWLALLTSLVTLTLVGVVRLALLRTRREFDAAQRLDDETALRQRTEMALVQAQKLEALGRLTGGVAHDFNNLLMVINNNLYVLRNLHEALRGSPHLAAIERSVAGGTKLTRQLLSFSRRQPLMAERIDLKDRLPMIVDLLRPVLGKDIQLDARVEQPVVIRVDPAELELALINLAVNAKDAMPRGGLLRLVARSAADGELDRPGRHVVIEMIDTGAGIAPDLLEHVFEPFFTTKTTGQGTGLGLSQVEALCASAGGQALIESNPGLGTRVRLFFPAQDRAASVTPGPADRPGIGRLDCSVLLVEDNDAVARTSAAVLESMGCTVEHVANADDALLRLAQPDAVFDIVLSDIEMPGAVDGIGLAEHAALLCPATPVILMTGYAARLQQAERLGLHVLPKPVNPEMLFDTIAAMLEDTRPQASRAA
ncbi:MAG TPA: ATP-binding protein [Burkholderiaceae bacterium]|nr:ATP-binding protein [Burkholderiaceae bacterium]